MAVPCPNALIVEGTDDRHAIIHLMRSHIDWPEDGRPVDIHDSGIHDSGGVDRLLAVKEARAALGKSGLKRVGIVADADADPAGRWRGLRDVWSRAVAERFDIAPPPFPETMPPGRLVVATAADIRIGFWLMPDNVSPGMLETFLHRLVPDSGADLWRHAERSFEAAVDVGIPCAGAHHDKARIHTWLAWQDPPGEPFGLALRRKILDPASPSAAPFVAWFKTLYEL